MSCITVLALALTAAFASPPTHGAMQAERWTPPALSTSGYEATPTFAPDGQSMYFMAADAAFSSFRLAMSRCLDGQWSAAQLPPFAAPGHVLEGDPFVTPDGGRLYYISTRHDPKGEDFDIWFVERTTTGGWGAPQRLPEPVNSNGSELLPRVDRSGRLYFGSNRAGGLGGGDIYVAEQDAAGRWSVENVGAPVSSHHYEYEAEVSQDGQSLIVVADRGVRSHLYRYVRRDGAWVEVGQVPAKEEQFQVGPLLSPAGDRLLFAQRDRVDSGEMFLIDLAPNPDRSWPPTCAGSSAPSMP